MELVYGVKIEAENKTKGVFDKVKKEGQAMASGVERAIAKTKKVMATFGPGIMKAGKWAASGFAAVGAAAVAMVGGLVATTLAASKTQDAVFLMTQRLGESAQEMTALGVVANQAAGVGLDVMSRAMTDLSGRAVKQEAIFKKWGVATKDASGQQLSASKLLDQVADRMAKASSQAEKLAIADELMGEAGRQLVPMLQEGAGGLDAMKQAAIDAGLAMTDFEANAGNALQTQLGTTKAALDSVTSAISGQLAPVMTVLATEAQNVVGQVAKWIRTNDELIQSGLQDFLTWIADSALPAIVTGANLAGKVFFGWKMILGTVKAAFAAWYGFIAGKLTDLLGMAERTARALGQDGIAASLGEAKKAAEAAYATLSAKSDEYLGDVMAANAEQARFERALESLGIKGSAAVRRVAGATKGLIGNLNEVKTAAISTGQAVASAVGGAADVIQRKTGNMLASYFETQGRLLDMQASDIEAMDARITASQERSAEQTAAWVDRIQSGFDAVLGAGVSAFSGIGEEVNGQTKTWGDAFKSFFGQLGVMMLKQLAQFAFAKAQEAAIVQTSAHTTVAAEGAKAAAGAASSQASIPIIGPALAVGAMTAILAAVLALTSGFNTGGIIGGGGINADSVLVRATPNEAFLDQEATAYLLRALTGRGGAGGAPAAAGAPSRSAPSASSGAGASGGRPIMLGMLAPPTNRTDLKRAYREMASEMDEMERTGQTRPSRRSIGD